MTIRTTKKSPNKNTGRNSWKPDIIVCHISEGYYESGCDWLCNPTSQASTHYFVGKKGEVSQLVDLKDTAWGNGTTTTAGDSRYYGNSTIQAVRQRKTSANYYTISIEHEGFYKDSKGSLTEAQLSATVELIQHIIKEVKNIFGIDIPVDRQHIVGHCDIAPKWKPNCPGQNFPFDEIIKRVKGNSVTAVYKISETNLTAMVNASVINSPDYWRSVTSIQYLDTLLSNAAKDGVLDKRINNGITDIDQAYSVLIDAGIINTADYWKSLVKSGEVKYLKDLIIGIANKCRIVLEKIVHAESQGEGLEGQEYVANVILNRCNSKSFPNGIYNVVFAANHFSPVTDGSYVKAVPSTSVKSAVSNVLGGKDNSKGALYFCSKATAGKWHEKALTFLFEHKNHRFYK